MGKKCRKLLHISDGPCPQTQKDTIILHWVKGKTNGILNLNLKQIWSVKAYYNCTR